MLNADALIIHQNAHSREHKHFLSTSQPDWTFSSMCIFFQASKFETKFALCDCTTITPSSALIDDNNPKERHKLLQGAKFVPIRHDLSSQDTHYVAFIAELFPSPCSSKCHQVKYSTSTCSRARCHAVCRVRVVVSLLEIAPQEIFRRWCINVA